MLHAIMDQMILTPADLEISIRLLVATLLGAVIGLEREVHGKEAGFKTYSLVCLGSALMMVVSLDVFTLFKGVAEVDPGRIAAQAVTGIGFLGAGAIIRSQQGGIRGLTTAAGIWAACAIGLACGLGLFKQAVFTTLLVLVILIIFSRLQRSVLPKKHGHGGHSDGGL
ncbi:MAG: MgtC/SapB family protein [Candidatus Omnitrophica bacterium]|nr:MgtC/SapB family protein [Candidatus Omnitrophota bacterium]